VVIDAVNLLTNFGTVLSTGDVNGDGNLDLIVGSPIARGDPSQGDAAIQRGVVNVFFSGSKWMAGLHTNDSVADITLYGQDQFGWFGSSITVCDWNNWVCTSRLCDGDVAFESLSGVFVCGA
jgi:FG-GAP repeat